MEKLKAGDIVCLASGGPKMTVSKVNEEIPTPPTDNTAAAPAWGSKVEAAGVTCQWFVRERLEKGVFPQESLVGVKQSES